MTAKMIIPGSNSRKIPRIIDLKIDLKVVYVPNTAEIILNSKDLPANSYLHRSGHQGRQSTVNTGCPNKHGN